MHLAIKAIVLLVGGLLLFDTAECAPAYALQSLPFEDCGR